MQDFMTPPKHVNFRAKKLFGEMGRIVDGSVAYIDLNGGGQVLFGGKATVRIEGDYLL